MNLSYTKNRSCTKRSVLHRILFVGLFILCSLSIYAQDSDNTEFWFVAPDASNAHDDRPTFLMITAGDKPTMVTISMPRNKSFKEAFSLHTDTTRSLKANEYWKFEFNSDNIDIIENDYTSSGTVTKKGIYIKSDEPISVYYQIDGHENHQKEIFTLKGKKALGEEFYMPFQTKYNVSPTYSVDAFRQIQIVATEDNTVVTIEPKGKLASNNGFIDSNSNLPDRQQTLMKGQTLLWRAYERTTEGLTGTKITSTSGKPIAVTWFEDCLQGTNSAGGFSGNIDPIGDQLVPVKNLGKNYILVKGYSNGNNSVNDHVGVLAVTNNTEVYLDNVKIETLQAGEYWSKDLGKGIEGQQGYYVKASHPVYCIHQSAGGAEIGGSLLPSLYSISGRRITFIKGTLTDYNTIFLVFRESAKDGFKINNKTFSDLVAEKIISYSPQKIGFETWMYAKVDIKNVTPLEGSVCVVENNAGSFSLGYFNGSSGGTCLYGYFSAFGTFSFKSDVINHCKDSYEFDAPYALTYKWTLPDGTTSTTSNLTATKSGIYKLWVDQDPYEIEDETHLKLQNFNNYALNSPKQLLLNKSYNFSIQLDHSDLDNIFNASYDWNFGDGAVTTPTENPNIVNVYYTTVGDKEITLKVTNEDAVDCSTEIKVPVKIETQDGRVMYWKSDARNHNWNDENNWVVKDGEGKIIADISVVPSAKTKVYLPGNAEEYPSLDEWNTDWRYYGQPEARDIVFQYGSQLHYQHKLKYENAYIQYNWGYYGNDKNVGQPLHWQDGQKLFRDTWHILAAPLKGMASGDFSLTGRPFSWQKKFQTTTLQDGVIEGGFFPAFADNAVPLAKNNNAIAVKMAEYNTQTGYQDQAYLENLKGVIEIPYFENSSKAASYPGHSYDALSEISNFYYFDTKTLKLLNSPVHAMKRGDEAYRFVYETEHNQLPADNTYKMSLNPKSISDSGEVMVGNPFLSPIHAWGFYQANNEVIDHDAGFKLLSEDGLQWVQKFFTENEMIPAWKAFIVTLKNDLSGKSSSKQASSMRDASAAVLSFPLETSPVPTYTLLSASTTRASSIEHSMGSSLYMGILKENVLSGDKAILQDEQNTSFSEILKMIQPEGHATPEVFFIDSEEGTSNLIQNYRQGQNEVAIGVKTSDVHSRLSLQFKNVPMFTATTGAKAVLVDKYLNIKQDLARSATYGFTQRATGLDKQSVDKTRFVLQLGNETTVQEDSENGIHVFYRSGVLQISSDETIDAVAVYDSQGRLVYSAHSIGRTEYTYSISLKGGIFVVQVKTASGKSKAEKITGY
ncbi:PKD domain-containing protein [Limibacterium fermenti]|uniref:PKD domain-containing protein n=1 Tax=Limibacterium fermenti TaxID=3229863 RepID=UPI000E98E94C|nr:hypothetical protein [Porphyromonadaceae bacterium]